MKDKLPNPTETLTKNGGDPRNHDGLKRKINPKDTVGHYLNEITQFPLLSREEEIELARIIQAGITAKEIIEAGTFEEEELANLQLTVQKGDEAHKKFVNANLRLAVNIAKKYQGIMPFSDLIQIANEKLIKLVEKFDPERGFKFNTYAFGSLPWMIIREIFKNRSIRLPVHLRDKMRAVKNAQNELTQVLNRKPTAAEIAERIPDLDSDQVSKILKYMKNLTPLSLNQPVSGGSDEVDELGYFVPGDADVEGEVIKNDLNVIISEALKQLSERERDMIKMKFGIETTPHTLEEIGEIYGLTRERVRQILVRAFSKIRSYPVLDKEAPDLKQLL